MKPWPLYMHDQLVRQSCWSCFLMRIKGSVIDINEKNLLNLVIYLFLFFLPSISSLFFSCFFFFLFFPFFLSFFGVVYVNLRVCCLIMQQIGQKIWPEELIRTGEAASQGNALSPSWESGIVQVTGRLGRKHPATSSEAGWQMLAASGPSARAIIWGFLWWGERATGESCMPTGWLPCLLGRGYDHRGSPSHLSNHAQHLGWHQGWDRCQLLSLGHLDSHLDCRGEPAWWSAEQISIPDWTCRHEADWEDHSIPDWIWHGM